MDHPTPILALETQHAHDVFIQGTGLQKLSVYTLESDVLDDYGPSAQYFHTCPLELFIHAKSNAMLYMAVIDVPIHESYHKQCQLLSDICKDSRIASTFGKLYTVCATRDTLECFLSKLYPIELNVDGMEAFQRATGLLTQEESDRRMARQVERLDNARRQAVMQQRGVRRTRSRGQENGDAAAAEGTSGDGNNERPTQRIRREERTHYQLRDDWMNALPPPFAMALAMMGGGGGGGILVDLSRPGPAPPLPDKPEEAKGTSLGTDWEALLKPDDQLVETEDAHFQCQACLTYIRSIITLPCRHQYYCDKCFRRHMSDTALKKTCPKCREPVTSIIRAYE